MKIIYKFAIEPDFTVFLPKRAQVLTVQIQHNQPQMWVLLKNDDERERRRFIAVPTGKEIPGEFDLRYINTFQLDSGLVFHVFEVV